jgi:hypothetical protein
MAHKKKPVIKEEPLFVGVENPANIRRSVLESAKELVSMLRRMEELKKIRLQKIELMEHINIDLRSIKTLVIKLKRKLPTQVARDHTPKPVPNVRAVASNNPITKARTELQILEDEIAAIESKLKGV